MDVRYICVCYFHFPLFFPSSFFFFWFHAAIPAQSSITVPNHSPAEIQPSGGREQNSTGTKVNIKQDADPELQVFLNQPEPIRHFNLYRGRMDASTRTHTRGRNCWYPLMKGNPHNGHWNNLKTAKRNNIFKNKKINWKLDISFWFNRIIFLS